MKLKYNCRFGDKTILLVIAYYEDVDENFKPIHDPEICIDVVHTEKGKIWHSERVNLDLSMTVTDEWENYDNGIPEIQLTNDRIYVCDGRHNIRIAPNVYEFDYKGNLLHSYVISPETFDLATLQPLNDRSVMSVLLASKFGHFRQLKLVEGDTTILKDL